jgi:hypothetical protein
VPGRASRQRAIGATRERQDPKNGVVLTQRMQRARQAASSLPSTSPPRSALSSRRSGSTGASDPTRSSTTASLTSRKATRSTRTAKSFRASRRYMTTSLRSLRFGYCVTPHAKLSAPSTGWHRSTQLSTGRPRRGDADLDQMQLLKAATRLRISSNCYKIFHEGLQDGRKRVPA